MQFLMLHHHFQGFSACLTEHSALTTICFICGGKHNIGFDYKIHGVEFPPKT